MTDTEISSTADPSPSYLSSTAWVYSSAASIRAASAGIAVNSNDSRVHDPVASLEGIARSRQRLDPGARHREVVSDGRLDTDSHRERTVVHVPQFDPRHVACGS
jgi:hypothetical protein